MYTDHDDGVFGLDAMRHERAKAYIARNLFSLSLTPDSVADAAGVSRSSLYRMFRAEGGVNRYIIRTRLAHARHVLGDPEDSRRISELAFESGFLSEAHFCRAFRRAYGCSPREARVQLPPESYECRAP